MKTKVTRIIIAVVLVIVVALMVLQLRRNKATVKANVEYAQQTVEKIPVTLEKVSSGVLDQDINVSSVLEAYESLMLMSETQGKITQVFKKKGDKVSKGEVIVKVDDEVIAANVMLAEANCAQFEKDVERLTRLANENAVAKRDLEQTIIGYKKAKADLINARKALDNTAIKAPISGYINDDFITVGQLLGGGAKVCEIVNNSSLKLNVAVSEQQVYKVNIGKEVNVIVSVFPDKAYKGIITSIAEKANDAMKFNVEVQLKNNVEPRLKSGMFAEVDIPVMHQEHLLISKKAIIGSMIQPEVYIVENNIAQKRSVVIGDGNNEKVEILQGLTGKESVIIGGQLNLNDGDEVVVVN